MPKPTTTAILTLAVGVLSLVLVAGCTHGPAANTPYTPMDTATRSPLKAEQLNQEAAALLEPEPAKAESLLREALAADLYFGPAHNNLGVLFLQQGKLYEAAGEFEWARKMLPGHPDPRLNLSLVLERAGHFDDAMKNVLTALEIHPGHIASLQQLCRLEIKYSNLAGPATALHGSSRESSDAGDPKRRDDLRSNLAEIALRGESPQWQDWARRQLIRLDARP